MTSTPDSAVVPNAPLGTITFLFTDVEGSTQLWEQEPVAMHDALPRHDAILRDAVRAHGGYVVKMTGDGMLAVFRAANDALVTAIDAQRTLHHEPWGETGPLKVRMGLHTGEAYLRDGDYYGQAPNRAARLMGLAHGGQVLVSAATAQLVRGRLDDQTALLDVGEHRMRGLARPERVFQVTHSELPQRFPTLASLDESLRVMLADMSVPFPERLRVPSSFVGRESELAQLDAAWAETQDGRGRLAMVGGEPGIGKSALLARFAARAHATGGIVLYGRCEEELGVPYGPFVEALDRLVPHLPELVLGAHLEEYGPQLAHLIPTVRHAVRGSVDGERVGSDEQRFQLFASVAALLRRVGVAAPIVFVIDDLHWSDPPTLALLRYLVRAEPMRVLVAGTYRDSDVRAGHPLRDLMAQPGSDAVAVTLAGLESGEVVALLELTGGKELDATGLALADELRRDTGGNPFFVDELLRHLAETGALVRDAEGFWQLHGELAELGLPARARDVIGHRVAHLGTDTQQVLSAAAVAGQEFDLVLLAAVLGAVDDWVLDQLERAADAALVANLSGDEFRFRHALVQHALYTDIGPARRSRLHLRVADALEGLGRAERHPEVLARHLAASQRPEALTKAVDYATRAGEAALDTYAPDQAAGHFREALRLLDEIGGSDARRCRVLVGLGTALRQLGDGSHRATLLEAAGLAQQLGDADRLVQAAVANSRGWASESGRVDEERVAFLRAALDATGSHDSAGRARLLALLASELTFSVDLEERRALSDKAVAIARRLNDLATLAAVLSSRFDSVRAPHLLAARVAACQENLEVARSLDDPLALWLATTGATQLAVETGDADALDSSLEAEIRLADELRQPYPRWLTLVHRTLHAYLSGRLDDADRLGTEALELGQEIAQPDAFAIYAGNLFSVWSGQGRVEELLPIMETASAANPLAGLRAALAMAYCLVDRIDDAGAILSELSAAGFENIHLDGVWLSTVVVLAGVAATVGDRAAARELLELLTPFETQFASDGAHVIGTVAQALGRLATLLGRDQDADRWFALAEAEEGAARAPLFQARTQLLLADALAKRAAPDSARVRTLAAQAQRTASELDSAPLAAHAAHLLRRW